MRRAIVSAFPELADAAFAVAGKGWHSLAVEVDGRLIFKFPEGEEAHAALQREARLLRRVAPHLVLPVPRMTLHEGPPLFSRHEKLRGETLLREGYLRLGEAARDRLADDLAGFFAQLHALEPAAMQAAGALPVGLWDTRDETLASVWEVLPPSCRAQARAALDAWRMLGPDPLGERYGFFDAHGWNMAFDADRGVLNGIFDFADSGLGPIHREFVPVSLIEPDLTARTIHAYERLTGREIDRRRIFLQSAAMRLSELAGEIETGGEVGWTRELVLDWFSQQAIR
jgi:aminoglycoside phosphotransferase (APT) family kinase protein